MSAAHAEAGRGWEGTGVGGGSRRSRVDAETASYLKEIVEAAKGVEDEEQKTAMFSSALDEIAGIELMVLSDAECSRLVEELVSGGTIHVTIKLLTVFADGDKFFELSTSTFGSHVAETLLATLRGQLESATQAESEAVEEAITEYMMDFAMDRSASHVARELLNTLAGREISPRKKGGAEGHSEGGSFSKKKKKKKKNLSGLAAKVVLDTSINISEPEQPLFPALISRLVTEVTNASQDLVARLVEDTYANPFLQVLAAAVHHDAPKLTVLVARLLGAVPAMASDPQDPLSAAPAERVADLARHRAGSHLVELCIRLLPPEAVGDLYARAFKGQTYEMCLHPIANFVVQSLIAATPEAEQLDGILEELQANLGDLLLRRRSGVVAALVAACARLEHGQVEMCRGLSRGLKATVPSGSSSKGREPGLAELLVTLDTDIRLGPDEEGGGSSQRFSPAGCAMLSAILAYNQVAAQKYIESFNQLAPSDIVRLASDSGGCRTVEAFVQNTSNLKMKGSLFKKLKGKWGPVALAGCSCAIAVERCYDLGKVSDREAIVAELAAKYKEIEAKYYGSSLLARLDVGTYKRDPEAWRRRTKTASSIKSDFMKMFGDEDRGSRGSEQTAGEGGNRAVPRAEGGGNGGGNAGAAGEASKALGDEVKVREKKKKRDAKAGRDGPGPGEADMKNKAKKKHEEDPSTEGLTGDAEAPDSAEIHGKKRRLEGKVAKKKKSKAGGA